MRPLIQEIETAHTPESLVEQLRGEPGVVLLRSALFDSPQARYSFVTARPFLTFRSTGSLCELIFPAKPGAGEERHVQFGNPWQVLDGLMARYELLDEPDLPFPLGGCFGFWGYDLKNFVEPRLPRRAVNDLELPDCQAGFHDSLVAFDHHLGKTWIISTGLGADGSRNELRAQEQYEFWRDNPTSHLRKPGETEKYFQERTGCVQSDAGGFHRQSGTRVALHSRGGHLSGEPCPAACGPLPLVRLGIFRTTGGGVPRAVFRVSGLQRISNSLVLAGTFPAVERPAHRDPADQGDPAALGG